MFVFFMISFFLFFSSLLIGVVFGLDLIWFNVSIDSYVLYEIFNVINEYIIDLRFFDGG